MHFLIWCYLYILLTDFQIKVIINTRLLSEGGVLMALNTESSLASIRGVGPKKQQSYARMGITNIGELLMHYPRGYEDRADIRLISDAEPDRKTALILTVATEPRLHNIRRGMSLLRFRAYDESASCEITFFNQNYLKDTFRLGEEYRFYGKIEKKGNKYFLSSPDYETYREENELLPLVPIYPLTEGISRNQITKDITSALRETSVEGAVIDVLPERLREKNRLCTLAFALKNIHFPTDYVSLAKAKKRLIYDEFLTFALGVSIEGRKNRHRPAEPCIDTDYRELLSLLPYTLTSAQKRVCEDICRDMSSDNAMSRMVVGDVGSGKTVCAAIAMYIAVKNGRQAALMAPTEILARQHFAELNALFEKLSIKCALLCGSMTPLAKKKVYAGLTAEDENERIDVVIGTHALLSEGVEFVRPGLVVTDEQHRFGVAQRAVLSEKNDRAHMLVMSATPIPRSLALAVYGDLDVSKIDELPPGRQRVDTFVVDEDYRARLDGFIEKQVSDGAQVYVVCPAIEDNEEEQIDFYIDNIDFEGNRIEKNRDMKAVMPYCEELRRKFPKLRIELLHGKMRAEEKDRIMLGFASGEVDVLVSTTVIEVGVNVPNASLMIVENAERFGLSQLHQLRGRVGRGKRKSYCVLVSSSCEREGTACERLKIMRSTYNGYEIAERDLVMRGPGDFVRGAVESRVRQSGGIRFRLAELCDDTGLLQTAFADARELISSDGELSLYPALRQRVESMFSLDSSEIS